MVTVATATLAVAVALDIVAGEFPRRMHPVRWFGRLVEPFDRSWTHPRTVGVLALGLPGAAAVLLGGVTAVSWRSHRAAGVVVASLVLFSVISLRLLLAESRALVALTGSDVDRARERARSLVGRETAALSPAELRSAAVESAAENLSDGFVAPLVAFGLGSRVSLSLAVGGAVWVKGVNTMDSMLGYEAKPVGWATARLDDAVMWIPARLTALLIAVAALDPRAVFRARSWAATPASPNAGWPMATLAAVLDVEVRKPGAYTLQPAATLPSIEAAKRGTRIVGVAGGLAVVLAGVMTL